MFTVDTLLDIAARAERAYFARTGSLSEAYHTMEKALVAAEWMEKNGIEASPYVGPFGEVTLKRGDKVRIKAGSKITSTLKSLNRTTTRPYTVTIHDVYSGFIHEHRGHVVRNPTVVWAGSGGYWCETEVANVEKVA